MTPTEFKANREVLGLSVRDLAYILNTNERTLRKWEDPADRGPNPVAVRVMEWMLDGFRPPEFPTD